MPRGPRQGFVPEAEVGDYVMVHAGFAISRVDAEEAQRTYEILDQLGALEEELAEEFGQQIIERLGGKRIHPAWVMPGGVSEPLSQLNRDAILAGIPEVLKIAERTLESFKSVIERFREEVATFGNFPTLFLGIVKKKRRPDLLRRRYFAL